MNPNKLDTLCAARSCGIVLHGQKNRGVVGNSGVVDDATASIVPRDDWQVGKVVPVLG